MDRARLSIVMSAFASLNLAFPPSTLLIRRASIIANRLSYEFLMQLRLIYPYSNIITKPTVFDSCIIRSIHLRPIRLYRLEVCFTEFNGMRCSPFQILNKSTVSYPSFCINIYIPVRAILWDRHGFSVASERCVRNFSRVIRLFEAIERASKKQSEMRCDGVGVLYRSVYLIESDRPIRFVSAEMSAEWSRESNR